ncbi:metalloproteinase inhibitor 1-like [Diadema setosum]|uniref:metalloproteinase inhibitor 1-like n=1 Tax=Diadema setosum TaxID=31175 RepID=UPI003B3A9B06
MAVSTQSFSSLLRATLCLVVAILPASLACMCLPTHPQQKFCQADYALAGHVLEKTRVTDNRLRGRFGQFEYIVSIDRVFKGEGILGKGRSALVTILTSPGDSLCGPLDMELGDKYLITGSIVEGDLQVSSCDWTVEWKLMSQQQKQGVKTFYGKYCTQCRVQSEMRAWSTNSPSSGCIYDPYPSQTYGAEDCQSLYATCLMQENESCQWYHRGNAYQDCIQRNHPYYQGVETAQSVNFPLQGV